MVSRGIIHLIHTTWTNKAKNIKSLVSEKVDCQQVNYRSNAQAEGQGVA